MLPRTRLFHMFANVICFSLPSVNADLKGDMHHAASNIKETIVRAPFTPEVSGREAFLETEAVVRRIPEFGSWVSEPIKKKRASLGLHNDIVYEVTTHHPTVTFREDEASILTLTREPLPKGQTKDLPDLEWVDASEGPNDAMKIRPSNPEKRPHLRVLSFSLGGEKIEEKKSMKKDVYRWNKKPMTVPTEKQKKAWERNQHEKIKMRNQNSAQLNSFEKDARYLDLPQRGNVHQPWEPLKEERPTFGPQSRRPLEKLEKQQPARVEREPIPDLVFSEDNVTPLPQGREPRRHWPTHQVEQNAKKPLKDRENGEWSSEDKHFMRNVAIKKQLGKPIIGNRDVPRGGFHSAPTTPVPDFVPSQHPPIPSSIISVPNLGQKLVLVQRKKKKERRTWKQRKRNQDHLGAKRVAAPVPTTPQPFPSSTDAPESPFSLENVFGKDEKTIANEFSAGEGEKRKRNIGSYSKPTRARSNTFASNQRSGKRNQPPEIPILKHVGNVEQDGARRFSYEFEGANGIRRSEEGFLKNPKSENPIQVIRGSYSYTGPDGKTYTINYIADENGFRASGDHIPT